MPQPLTPPTSSRSATEEHDNTTLFPTFSPQENKEWSDSKNTGEYLLGAQMPEERRKGWIRMYDICENKQMLKDMGFGSIEAYAAHLRETHREDAESEEGHGFSVSNFRKYRNEGRVYKALFLGGIPFADMPHKSATGQALDQKSEEFKRGEHSVHVVDLWKAAVRLGGKASRTRTVHILKAFKNATNGILTPSETEAAATAAEIQKLKDDMEKAKDEKEAMEKKAKDDLEALKKKRESDRKKVVKAFEDMEEKHKLELENAKKRALPDDIRKEMEHMEGSIKSIKGYVAGFEYDERDNTYYRYTNQDLTNGEVITRKILDGALLTRENAPKKFKDATMHFLVKTFAPYVLCHKNIGEMYKSEDSPNLLNADDCLNFLGEGVVVADREEL